MMRVLLAFLCISTVGPSQQTRDIGTLSPPTGTGRIAGVVTDVQARPVHNAIVTLAATELPAGRATVTDATGRFAFDQLPAGHFTLSSSKPAYLQTSYGAVRPGGKGNAITLAVGQQLAGITLTMPHGGAIAGIIRDSKSQPLPGIQVSVIRTSIAAGNASPVPDAVNTDDRGYYRVFGLGPGTYVVAAAPRFFRGLGEVTTMSTSEVDAVLARLRIRGSTPPAPADARSRGPVTQITTPLSTTPVYFPGVTTADAATPVALKLGEERGDIDFVYQFGRVAMVRGTVTGAASFSNAQISLTPDDLSFEIPQKFGAGPMLQTGQTAADGTFTFSNVRPGRYTVRASVVDMVALPGGQGSLPNSTAGPRRFAATTIDVTGDDVADLSLALQPTVVVSGRLSFSPSAMTPAADLTTIRVRLTPVNPNARRVVSAIGVATTSPGFDAAVRADGTFAIDRMIPGAYRISTIGAPAGWWLKTAIWSDRDALDYGLDVRSSDVTGIAIGFSDQHSQLDGRLLGSSGAPATGYFVIAFSADRSVWLPQSRRLRSVRPSTDGQFRFDDLPAGEYYVAALTDGDADDWQSSGFLAEAIQGAIKVTLGDGERKTQDLRIGG